MDLKWFLRYLTLARWSKLIAALLGVISFSLIGYHFWKAQKEYRQKVWEFQNMFYSSNGLILEPNRVYKIGWELPDKNIPTAVEINGTKASTANYFERFDEESDYEYYCPLKFTNPMYVKVSDSTEFKLYFTVWTIHSRTQDATQALINAIEESIDPISVVEWSVVDLTDKYYSDHRPPLAVDRKFELVPIKNK